MSQHSVLQEKTGIPLKLLEREGKCDGVQPRGGPDPGCILKSSRCVSWQLASLASRLLLKLASFTAAFFKASISSSSCCFLSNADSCFLLIAKICCTAHASFSLFCWRLCAASLRAECSSQLSVSASSFAGRGCSSSSDILRSTSAARAAHSVTNVVRKSFTPCATSNASSLASFLVIATSNSSSILLTSCSRDAVLALTSSISAASRCASRRWCSASSNFSSNSSQMPRASAASAPRDRCSSLRSSKTGPDKVADGGKPSSTDVLVMTQALE
mmetsp:Transcript_95093/g.254094  ORF Transcript_95093/g.254094 Transcript_95093/m.254094 type:complete len:273 (+) Transcript_95093:134-952(+)